MDRSADFTRLATAEAIARRMDNAARVPFTRITFGWDSVLGLIPGIGDTLALLPSLYILNAARLAGAPRRLLVRMAANLGIDWAIGLVPLLGDVLDVANKANLRNAALLRAHVELRHAARRPDTVPSDAGGPNVVPLFPLPDDPGPDAPPLDAVSNRSRPVL